MITIWKAVLYENLEKRLFENIAGMFNIIIDKKLEPLWKGKIKTREEMDCLFEIDKSIEVTDSLSEKILTLHKYFE